MCSLLRYRFSFFSTVCIFLFGLFVSLNAATLPQGFTETQVASGLLEPTAMEFAPDGRLFVCLQGGQLRVIKNGALLATPFLTVSTDSSGERGLLGVAFDPNFQSNKFVYVYYTAAVTPRHNRVSRFIANGDVAVAGSEEVILQLDALGGATNHNGGAIHFGPDGKLYVGVGENAVASNAQTLTNRLGKVLRINPDGSIPSDNPFFNTASGDNRSIWALGLRNPFTFAFQPNTGRLFINDVGAGTWEEINDGIAGSNYGWPQTEGPTSDPKYRSPLFSYGHGNGPTTGCAIAGGAFYNPPNAQFPSSYIGKYFFADLCSGWIRVLDPANKSASGFATGIANPVDLKVANDGSLYYLSIGAGVFRVQFSGAPTISKHPANQSVIQGQPATFNVVAAGTAPLSYQWQRNTVNISGANAASYTIAATTQSDNGARFRCVVSNSLGEVTSNQATLTVKTPPSITSQPADQTVSAGETATFSVSAAGTAPLSYQWQRNMVNISGANAASYTIPATTEADDGARFRCIVSNSVGNATSSEAVLTVQPSAPILLTEEDTDLAIAFDSVTMFRDPFPLTTTFNFSSDHRTRLMLFAVNADLLPGETKSAVKATAEDSLQMVYPLTVEFVGKVPGFDWLTQVVVKLPTNLNSGDVFVYITLHGQTSNKVRFRIQ